MILVCHTYFRMRVYTLLSDEMAKFWPDSLGRQELKAAALISSRSTSRVTRSYHAQLDVNLRIYAGYAVTVRVV